MGMMPKSAAPELTESKISLKERMERGVTSDPKYWVQALWLLLPISPRHAAFGSLPVVFLTVRAVLVLSRYPKSSCFPTTGAMT